MSRDANRAANYLKSLGVGKGDQVLVQLPRVPEWYFTVPGCSKLGADDHGTIQPARVEGNLAVRTEPRPVGLFLEYWRDPERNAEAFRRGWYFTGDRAYKDEDGYIWFVGRADDVIISAAYRIGPFEVESALLEHPAVAEAAVVGKPDAARGQVVEAFIVLAAGREPSNELAVAIQELDKRVTAPYKYPRDIQFVAELPKTISGKIRRVELRNADAAGWGGGVTTAAETSRMALGCPAR